MGETAGVDSGQDEPANRLHSRLSDTGLQEEIDQLSSGADEEEEEELYDDEIDDIESQNHYRNMGIRKELNQEPSRSHSSESQSYMAEDS